MKKIILFYGSDRAFADVIPKSYRNLSDIAMQMDDESKQMQLVAYLSITKRLELRDVMKGILVSTCGVPVQ